MATLLTRILVDPGDPAFDRPTKPIGPVYGREEAERLAAEKGWAIAPDGGSFRRVVPSPDPKRILELGVIELLVRERVIVVCAGGGGIPVEEMPDGSIRGVEAVIDKDFAGALLATSLHADAFLMLTDVDAVYADWGTPSAWPIHRASPETMLRRAFAAGSMAPKVAAACRFVQANSGFAAIGSLSQAAEMLRGESGHDRHARCAPDRVGDRPAAGAGPGLGSSFRWSRRPAPAGPPGPARPAYLEPQSRFRVTRAANVIVRHVSLPESHRFRRDPARERERRVHDHAPSRASET